MTRTLVVTLAMLVFGCDAEPPTDAPRADLELATPDLDLVARTVCEDACNVPHCENVVRWIGIYEDDDRWCEAECMHEQVACLLEPATACGQCELDAAVCRSECLP